MTAIRRLLLVTDAPYFGGAERYLGEMCAAALRRCIKASICWLKPRSAAPDVISARYGDGVPVENIPEPTTAFAALTDFRAVLCRQRPDAIVFNASGRPRFWLLPWVARIQGIPAAWVHHMVDTRDHRRLPPRHFGRRMEGLHLWRVPQTCRHHLAARAAAAVITSNEEDRGYVARWHRVGPRRLHVIPPGINIEPFQRSDAESGGRMSQSERGLFIVGTAARLNGGKGVDLLIEAAGRLRAQGLPVILRIAGEGPERSKLQQLARRHRIADVVEFLGEIRDLAAYYNDLDVFTLCSQTESFGLALAEAMACARPVVATPTAGARLQIEPDRTGCVLSAYSAVELASVLGRLYADVAGREEMGRRARNAVLRHFTIDQTLTRILEVLGPRTPQRPIAIPCAALAREDVR